MFWSCQAHKLSHSLSNNLKTFPKSSPDKQIDQSNLKHSHLCGCLLPDITAQLCTSWGEYQCGSHDIRKTGFNLTKREEIEIPASGEPWSVSSLPTWSHFRSFDVCLACCAADAALYDTRPDQWIISSDCIITKCVRASETQNYLAVSFSLLWHVRSVCVLRVCERPKSLIKRCQWALQKIWKI